MMSQRTRRMRLQEQVLRRVSLEGAANQGSSSQSTRVSGEVVSSVFSSFPLASSHVGAIILRTDVSGKRPRQLRREERPEYLSGVQLFLCRRASRASGESPV